MVYQLPTTKVSVNVTNSMLAEMVQQALYKHLGLAKYRHLACDEQDNIYLDMGKVIWQNNPEASCLIRAIDLLKEMGDITNA